MVIITIVVGVYVISLLLSNALRVKVRGTAHRWPRNMFNLAVDCCIYLRGKYSQWWVSRVTLSYLCWYLFLLLSVHFFKGVIFLLHQKQHNIQSKCLYKRGEFWIRKLKDSFGNKVLLWPPGASTLDPEMCGRYKLSVMVKDMAGKANAFFTTGIVTVEVTGNTWASPDPVRLQENLPGPYPIPISQVRRQYPDQHGKTSPQPQHFKCLPMYTKAPFTYCIFFFHKSWKQLTSFEWSSSCCII